MHNSLQDTATFTRGGVEILMETLRYLLIQFFTNFFEKPNAWPKEIKLNTSKSLPIFASKIQTPRSLFP